MSRSRKKHSFTTFCGGSNKVDKQIANRKFRRRTKSALSNENYDEVPMNMKEVSDTWDFTTDGLAYYCPEDEDSTFMRK